MDDDHIFHPAPEPFTPQRTDPPPLTASPTEIAHWIAIQTTTTHPDITSDQRRELAPFLNADFATQFFSKPEPLTTTAPPSEEFAVGAVITIASDNPELLGPFTSVTATVEITHTTGTAITGIEFVYVTVEFTRRPTNDHTQPGWQVTTIDRHHQPRPTS